MPRFFVVFCIIHQIQGFHRFITKTPSRTRTRTPTPTITTGMAFPTSIFFESIDANIGVHLKSQRQFTVNYDKFDFSSRFGVKMGKLAPNLPHSTCASPREPTLLTLSRFARMLIRKHKV